jgi:predicted peptidase
LANELADSSRQGETFLMKFNCVVLAICLWVACSRPLQGQEFIQEASHPQPLASSAQLDRERSAFQPFEFASVTGIHLPYRLLSPTGKAPTEGYPLVLVLHGSDGIGTDNLAQLSALILSWANDAVQSRFPAYVVAPQFPTRSAAYQISPADNLLASYSGVPLLAALELVDKLAATLPIDRSRIYIVGFSMGASTGWHAMLLRPHLFAAAVLASGTPPERSNAASLGTMPLLITHGNVDPENPFEPDRAMYAALRLHGGNAARFREYDNMAHAVPPDMLLATPETTWWRDWLFHQIKQP